MHIMNAPADFCGTLLASAFHAREGEYVYDLKTIPAPPYMQDKPTYRQRMERASFSWRVKVRACDLVHIAPLSHSELISRRADAAVLTPEEKEAIRETFVKHWAPVRKPAGWSLRQCRAAEIREFRRSSGCRGKNLPIQRANPGLYCGGGRMSQSAYPRANQRYLAQADVITFQRVEADDNV